MKDCSNGALMSEDRGVVEGGGEESLTGNRTNELIRNRTNNLD